MNNNFLDEDQIPDNWVDAPKTAPIIPGSMPAGAAAPPAPHDMPPFFSGSMPPQLQLATKFDSAQIGTPRIPKNSLMPFGPQANPSSNAAAESTVTKIIESGTTRSLDLKTNGVDNQNQGVLNLEAGTGILLASDSSGGVVITGSASVPQWPLPNTAIAYMARAIVGQTALQCIGDNSPSTSSAGTGGVANGTIPTSADGVSVSISSSTINSAFGWNASGGKVIWGGRNNQFQARMNITNATGGVFWVGMSDQTAVNLRTFTPLGNIAAFLIGGSPSIQGVIVIGAVITSIPITATITGSTTYKIIMNDIAGTTTFYIDEVAVGTITGHNFTGGWWPTISLWQNNTGNPAANVDYFYVQQDF